MMPAVALVLTGCNTAAPQDAQYDDARNPYYKQAQQDLDNNDPAKAALDYQAALGVNPKLTQANYDLGHIYGDKLSDPIGAIFYFQQYLKLAPTGDKAEEVKTLIDKESQAFAASLPNSTTQNAADYARLQADNASLKKQVEDATQTIAKLQTQLAKHHPAPEPAPAIAAASTDSTAVPATPAAPATDAGTPVAATTSTNDATATPPAGATNAAAATPPRALPIDSTNFTGNPAAPADAASGPARSYKVVKGDSIWKIAHKMYPGDIKNGMEKIQDANKEILTGKPLKIGQVLVIPD